MVLLTLVAALLAVQPAAPAAASGTPRIAFARSSGTAGRAEIFTMAADGGDVVRLTRNDVEDDFPAVSPDGSEIAFARTRGGTTSIYVMAADGGAVRRVTRGVDSDTLPEWSPDGAWIVFTRNFVRQNQADLFKVRNDGTDTLRLTATPEIEYAPEWSPDGRSIAYSRVGARQQRFGIGVMRADGTRRRWVVSNPRSERGFIDVSPTWAPSGHRIAFARETRDHTFDIFSVRPDGAGLRRLTRLPTDAVSPTWSGDGRIAFMLRNGIAVMRRDGTDLHLITSGTGDENARRPYTSPDWSPGTSPRAPVALGTAVPQTLRRGDRGEAVEALQGRLGQLRYHVGEPDGVFGYLTEQAVLAFQKVNGLTRDGIAGPRTFAALADPVRPLARTRAPRVLEVAKDAQVALFVRDGRVRRILNASTGTAATPTPVGRFRTYRQIDGWHTSPLGLMYRPKYFHAGYAVHGAPSVPAYAASHGCVRVNVPGADFLWDRLPIGAPVRIDDALRTTLSPRAGR